MSDNLIGATTAIFIVSLSIAVAEPVDVAWSTRDGTAKAGTDYQAANGVVTFLPGETEKQIEVIVYGQNVSPTSEKNFFINLTPPTNAVLGTALIEAVIKVEDESGVPVTSVIVAQGKRGLKGDPGLSAYEQAVLMGYTGTLEDWMQEQADAAAAAQRASDYAAAAASAATKAENAATAASFLGNIFPTPEAGVDPVTGVQNGAYYNVRSTDDSSYLVEYQNVGGVPTPSGKAYPSAAALDAATADAAYAREAVEEIVDPDTGKAIASKVFDKTGASVQEVNDFNLGNYVSLPRGLFTGQPAKFGGIQYIWDAESTATPEDNLIIQVTGVSAGRWVIHAYDGCIYSHTVNNIQKALDYCARNKLKFVQTSDLTLSTDLYVNTFESNPENDYFQYDAAGHKLHFTSGALHFKTSRWSANGLRVSTDDVNAKGAIVIRPFLRQDGVTVGYPVRFSFIDSQVTKSKTNGWYISNTWIGQWFGCYARFSEKWGVYLDHLDTELGYYNISCNNLVWVGGEIQGNGRNDGSGGGIYHGRLIGGVWSAVAIESNFGDGLNIVGANNNIVFDHCYIESNGSLPTNRDVRSPSVGGSSGAANRPRNITFKKTNHTPKSGQERCFELYDIINLTIDNPIFYGSASTIYTQEPIYVGESFSSSSSGKVINPTLLSTLYTQKPLLNDCAKFGELRKAIVLTGVDFAQDVDTAKYIFVSEIKEHISRWNKITFKFIAIPNSNLQSVRLNLSARGYPVVTQYSFKEETVTPSSGSTIQTFSHESTPAAKNNLNGGLGWIISRLGTHAEDTSTVPIQCVGAELEYYVGVVS